MLLLSSADFFLQSLPFKNHFRSTIRVSNGLDPNQDRRSGSCSRREMYFEHAKLKTIDNMSSLK